MVARGAGRSLGFLGKSGALLGKAAAPLGAAIAGYSAFTDDSLHDREQYYKYKHRNDSGWLRSVESHSTDWLQARIDQGMSKFTFGGSDKVMDFLGDRNSDRGAPAGWGEAAAQAGRGGENGSNPSQGGQSSGGPNAASVINIARKYLGMPYKWGGSNPKTSFDCSGLMQWSFGKAGVRLPRTARQQQQVGKAISKNAVRPGDLVFWGKPAHHVAMVVGPNQILEAPRTGKNLRIRRYSDGEITNARRVLGSVGNVGDFGNGDSGGSDAAKQTGQTGGDTGTAER
jgi:cell wall-associated NlpC family hydrolase